MQNNLCHAFQSRFRPHHITKTALTRILNDILQNNDALKTIVLVSLDINATFEKHFVRQTVTWVGLTGTVLN